MALYASRMSVFFLLLIGATLLPKGDAFIVEAVGFGIQGVVKGSIAALWHSTIGNVAAGSTFATLQSIGATAALSNPISAAVVGVGAGTAYYLSRD